MAETLWAPWRMEYILSEKTSSCVFCDAVNAGKDAHREHLVLAVTPLTFVIMNRYPYAHAHIMVIPRRHTWKLGELSPKERCDFMDLTVNAQLAIEAALKPQGINIGMNLGTAAGAGIKDHLHIHIVPRWNGDTNFMPLLGDTKVMPDHLTNTYDTLLPYFSELNSDVPRGPDPNPR